MIILSIVLKMLEMSCEKKAKFKGIILSIVLKMLEMSWEKKKQNLKE